MRIRPENVVDVKHRRADTRAVPTNAKQRRTFGEHLGLAIRTWRESMHDIRQSDLVAAARLVGLNWSQSSVADLEAGRRTCTAQELLLLPVILNEAAAGRSSPTLTELLTGDDVLVELAVNCVPDAVTVVALASGRDIDPGAIT